MRTLEVTRNIHDLEAARVQRHAELFTRQIGEFFGKLRPTAALIVVEAGVLQLMHRCALDPEEVSPLLAQYGYKFRTDKDGNTTWNLGKIEKIKQDEAKERAVQIPFQPPTRIRVNEVPRAERSGLKKKNSDGEYPGTDRTTRWSRGT